MPVSKKNKKPYRKSVRRIQRQVGFKGYSYQDEFLASPDFPMPKQTRDHYFLLLFEALDELEGEMSVNSWNLISEVVNLMQTFVLFEVCDDADDLIADGVNALADAGRIYIQNRQITFTKEQALTIRAIANDFTDVAQTVPHRQMVRCHRITEARIQAHIKNKDSEIIFVKTTEPESSHTVA